jgi:hypothetical protein
MNGFNIENYHLKNKSNQVILYDVNFTKYLERLEPFRSVVIVINLKEKI